MFLSTFFSRHFFAPTYFPMEAEVAVGPTVTVGGNLNAIRRRAADLTGVRVQSAGLSGLRRRYADLAGIEGGE